MTTQLCFDRDLKMINCIACSNTPGDDDDVYFEPIKYN